MPELLLHFSIPFALSAPIIGVRRALVVGFISILPDLDVLFHVHRSISHSIVLLSIIVVACILLSHMIGRGAKFVTASGLGLLSHPLLDLFQSSTPVLYPLSRYSYHISPELFVSISEEIIPRPAISIESEPVNFIHFHSVDAPIFTDTGFIISLLLISIPMIYSMRLSYRGIPTTSFSKDSSSGVKLLNGAPTSIDDRPADGKLVGPDDVTVLIPTLNEEEAIGRVIQELKKYGYRNILVVDGYSRDRTVEIARENGAEVIYQVGHGKAAAIKTGLERVRTPYVLVMDGDWTYDPKDIERLLRVAVEYGCDEVIGYRVDRENIPFLNRVGNRLISSVISLLMGHRVKDPCSGMYLLRTDMARNLEIASAGFDVEAEIVTQVLSLGRVAEVPISYRRRIGKSKLRSWYAGFRILLTAVKLGWLYNPVFLFGAIGSIFGAIGLIILFWQLITRYLYGAKAWSVGWAWAGLVLLIIGLQAFSIAMISLLLKRMERRMIQLFRKLS